MFQLRTVSAALAVSIGLVFVGAPAVMAQTAGGEASSSMGASTPKQVRKAERKAARAKKNAELKALEKSGYRTSGDQDNYPQNLQGAERKAAASKAATPTSASGQ
jgi:hypothetical protein